MNAACPPPDVLLAGLSGSADPGAMASLEQHVEGCTTCQERLQRLANSPETLDQRLHNAGSAPAQPADPDFARAVRRLLDKSADKLAAGQIINEYRLEELLGEGGMGAVWKARHLRLDMTVALKVIGRRLAGDPAAEERFEREMKAVGRLQHPNIIRAHDAGEADGRPYLVMEFAPGLDLDELVRRSGPLATSDACEAVRQAALGLRHAHESGLVHRDVKPSNLQLTTDGVVKVLDLGLARWEAAAAEAGPCKPGDSTLHDGLTGANRVLGTRDYMAPEQLSDARSVDARADVYGLGCTLVYLLTGRPPRKAESVPPGVSAAVFRKLLAPEPVDRYADAAEVAAALTPRCRGADLRRLLDPSAPAPSAPVHSAPGRRAVLAALALVGLAATVGLAYSRMGRDNTTVVTGPPRGRLPMTADEARTLQSDWAAALGRPVASRLGPDIEFTLVPPGEFGLSTECRAVITRPYLISTHEISVGQFKAFVAATGHVTDPEKDGKGGWVMDRTAQDKHKMQQRRIDLVWQTPGYASVTDDHPITQVSWNDAAAYCEWLTAGGPARFRLPTEAEWRWACRAGCAGEFYFGDDPAKQKDHAWYLMNAFHQPKPVGRLAPNGWGLRDTLGNVAEWCHDIFGDYPSGTVEDYCGPPAGKTRVLAGGSHLNSRVTCLMRDPSGPAAGISFVGFRVVAEIDR